MTIQPGDVIGDYKVVGLLGRGGMGKVFRVRNLITDREEAMKVMLPELDQTPGVVDRFLREIKVHASLDHPNIAMLRTALRSGDAIIMILELIEGVSLEEKLRQGPLAVPVSASYAKQVLAALDYSHTRGIIHRDIKPANVLITNDGTVKLTDFGIARSLGTPRLTQTGFAVGTIAYMSPEQIRSDQIDGRSDIYSLGLTFYEMVTGRRAVQGDTWQGIMNAKLTLTPPHPITLNPSVPVGISAAIMRALEKDPARRFQTAAEFAVTLDPSAPVSEQRGAPDISSKSPYRAAEIADLEARLARILGPVAKRLVTQAERRYSNTSELRQALAAHIEDPKQREEFTRVAMATATMIAAPVTGSSSFDPATLDQITAALAPYVGPIAKVLVRRIAGTAHNLAELLDKLAAEIPSLEERRRFLAAIRSLA
jgi:serine/threonine-protein kinase